MTKITGIRYKNNIRDVKIIVDEYSVNYIKFEKIFTSFCVEG